MIKITKLGKPLDPETQARIEGEKQEKANALRARAGVTRIILSSESGDRRIFATNDPKAEDFCLRRLPGILEAELARLNEAPVDKASGKAVRVLFAPDNLENISQGDCFYNLAEVGQKLQFSNPHGAVHQARTAGRKYFTIRKVVLCFLEDAEEATEQWAAKSAKRSAITPVVFREPQPAAGNRFKNLAAKSQEKIAEEARVFAAKQKQTDAAMEKLSADKNSLVNQPTLENE